MLQTFKLKDFLTFIFAILVHILIFRVDVDHSLLTNARELKIATLVCMHQSSVNSDSIKKFLSPSISVAMISYNGDKILVIFLLIKRTISTLNCACEEVAI